MAKHVILGAGLAGLSAAYHLKEADYLLFEAESSAGGLCRTEKINGFTFDYTGHFLHFKIERVKNLVMNLVGDKLLKHTRKSGIYLYSKMTPYPFQLNTFGHSPEVVKSCLMGLIHARYDQRELKVKNFEDWILKTCGCGVAEHFMFPYNTKIWTVPPKEMTVDWLSAYVPVPEVDKAIDGALKAPDETIGYNANFYYPAADGISALPNSFLPHVKNLHLNSRVEAIDIQNKTVSVNGQSYAYDRLISSLPLKALISLISDCDPKFKKLAGMLRHNSVYTVNLGVKRTNLCDYHWLYFPEEQYVFYRVGFPSQLAPAMAPSGMASLSVEISHALWRPIEREGIQERVVSDLIKAGILRNDDEIVHKSTMEIPYGYVVYDHNRSEILPEIKDYLSKHGIVSIGRYGSWEYSGMEDAIMAGIQAVEGLS